eukprot:589800-Pelagomonas_calceolata.AAC.1
MSSLGMAVRAGGMLLGACAVLPTVKEWRDREVMEVKTLSRRVDRSRLREWPREVSMAGRRCTRASALLWAVSVP